MSEYNQFFEQNYKYLLGFAKSIDPKNDYENLLHGVYLKCRDRIEVNGFQGDGYLNFTRVAIMNTFKGNYRLKKKMTLVDIDDQCYYNTIEDALLDKEYDDIQDKEIQDRNVLLVTSIYEYLDQFCSQRDVFVFRTYYLLKHKHLNYKQLSEATGYSITTVSNAIKRLKKELRLNIICYIKTGMRMEELLKEVQNVLSQPISHNFDLYRQMYSKITGSTWNGCACKKQRLHSWLLDWYNNNKNKI